MYVQLGIKHSSAHIVQHMLAYGSSERSTHHTPSYAHHGIFSLLESLTTSPYEPMQDAKLDALATELTALHESEPVEHFF